MPAAMETTRQPWLGRLKNVNPAQGALISITRDPGSNSWNANYIVGRKDYSRAVSCPLHKLPHAHVVYLFNNAAKYVKLDGTAAPSSTNLEITPAAASFANRRRSSVVKLLNSAATPIPEDEKIRRAMDEVCLALAEIAGSRGISLGEFADNYLAPAADRNTTSPPPGSLRPGWGDELHLIIRRRSSVTTAHFPPNLAIGRSSATSKYPPPMPGPPPNYALPPAPFSAISNRSAGPTSDGQETSHPPVDPNIQRHVEAWRCNQAFRNRLCPRCRSRFARAHVQGCDILSTRTVRTARPGAPVAPVLAAEAWAQFENDRARVSNDLIRAQLSILDSLLNHGDFEVFEALYEYLDAVLLKS
ncbi:hypothetical protein BJ742DRAFT_394616 [Cladochytrium replicatum]|nr:hypothetical protein BJ742DRAFT_394616 [Cladochytrium replicatum]